jgi:predicted nucleic acid-binding protein
VSFLIDTNVVSELRKARPDANVRAWLESVNDADLYLSVLVLGELRQGVELLRRRDAPQADALETWLVTLERAYRDRVIPVTAPIADVWGRLNVPDRMPAIDGLLAATAKLYDLILVTRHTHHVSRAGIPVLNPFEPGA